MPTCSALDCRAIIDWAIALEPGPGGKRSRMPVDHDSAGDPRGNLAVWA
jgi:hypothetical protein